MPTFPTISSGSMKVLGGLANEAMAMYPSTLSHSFVTRVLTTIADREQRWSVRGDRFGATLEYHNLSGADTSLVKSFFLSARGKYAAASLSDGFTITIGGVTHDYCYFDQDEFNVEVARDETCSFSLKITQLRSD